MNTRLKIAKTVYTEVPLDCILHVELEAAKVDTSSRTNGFKGRSIHRDVMTETVMNAVHSCDKRLAHLVRLGIVVGATRSQIKQTALMMRNWFSRNMRGFMTFVY